MILAPTTRRVIRPFDKPSFVHTQRYGLVKGHWSNESRVGLWLLNDLGNEVLDLSGGGTVGTFAGGTTPVWASGKFGSVLYFNGGWVNFGDGTGITLDRSAFAVSCWVNSPLTTPGIARQMASQEGSGLEDVFRLFWNTDNKVYFDVWDSDHTSTQAGSDGFPFSVANSWHHFMGVYDGAKTYLYVDGAVQSNTGVLTKATRSSSDKPLRIGSDSDGNDPWNGSIDLPMFWKRAPSASEIAELTYNPFLGIERRTRISYFFIPAAVGGINYEDLLLGVSISASVSETDTQQMLDKEKDVSIAASVSEVDTQQMLDTNKSVSFVASVSETDTQQMVDTSLGVTVAASLNVTDNQQMKDLLKDVSFAASISETDTQQMKDLLKAVTFVASCGIETEVYHDASAAVFAMFAFIILRQHTS